MGDNPGWLISNDARHMLVWSTFSLLYNAYAHHSNSQRSKVSQLPDKQISHQSPQIKCQTDSLFGMDPYKTKTTHTPGKTGKHKPGEFLAFLYRTGHIGNHCLNQFH